MTDQANRAVAASTLCEGQVREDSDDGAFTITRLDAHEALVHWNRSQQGGFISHARARSARLLHDPQFGYFER